MTIFSDSDYLKIRERLEDTNVFSILGLENYEIRHSNFLAWVLNPHETHNLGSNICKNLIQQLFPKFSGDIRNISIEREKFNIDILIECKNDVLVLENKIRSKDHSKQLQRYRQKIQTDKRYANKEKHYSYLTLHGEEPTDISEGNYWSLASYKELTKKLKELSKDLQKTLDHKNLNFINDYVFSMEAHTLKNHEINALAKSLSTTYKEEILELAGSNDKIEFKKNNHQRAIEFIKANSAFYTGNGFFRRDNYFYEAFSEGLKKHNFKISEPGINQTTYFSFTKNNLQTVPFNLQFRFDEKQKNLSFAGVIQPETSENLALRQRLLASREDFKSVEGFVSSPRGVRHVGVFIKKIAFNPLDYKKEKMNELLYRFMLREILPEANVTCTIVQNILGHDLGLDS